MKAPEGPMNPPSCFITSVVVVVVIGTTRNAQGKTTLSKLGWRSREVRKNSVSYGSFDDDHDNDYNNDYDYDYDKTPCSRERQSLFASHRQSRWPAVWS